MTYDCFAVHHHCVQRSFFLTERKSNMKSYINEKLKMLRGEFYLNISDEEEAHMRSLKTEIAVDNYAHSLIVHKLAD